MTPYLKLMRFHFHISFISVIAGALFFAEPDFRFPVTAIFQCYVLFNVLLYGGIYTFNDIIDVAADAAHGTKKNRPLPSGQLGIGPASLFCALLIGVSLYFSQRLFSNDVLLIFLAFVAANAAYTLALKKIPYAGLSIVALTHTLRLVLGIVIANGSPDPYFFGAFYAMLFCIAVTIHGTYNVKPEDKKYYPRWALIACQIACSIFIVGLAMHASPSSVSWRILLVVFSVFVASSHLHFMRHPLAVLFMAKEKKK
ncbi:hypothetical protein CY658_02750 [Variovorax sp. RO1]|uniref:UbiA family prenyltransferase n=1 Tax=Variovorax sp. RO1 TaxID=2066034 RepID=UPI000C717F3D|nr:UbiA family prenyltransferase [Variovorax sp. RO1]PLC05989.1 hypothetical protein CY658_02750 [Variovorax sp. RO1]